MKIEQKKQRNHSESASKRRAARSSASVRRLGTSRRSESAQKSESVNPAPEERRTVSNTYTPTSKQYRANRRKQWKDKKRTEKEIRRQAARSKRRENARLVDARTVDNIYRIMLVIVLAAAIGFVATAFFRVRTIEVNGCINCQSHLVAEASDIHPGDRLLFIHRKKASAGILEAQPYADAIRIRRRFPSTVVIDIIESDAAAAVVSGKSAYLIDKNCKLLEFMPYEDCRSDVIITGLDVLPSVPGKKIELSNALYVPSLSMLLDKLDSTGILPHVTDIAAAHLYNVSFRYDGRLTVDLGDMTDLDRKLELFEVVSKQLGGQIRGRLSIADSRVTFTAES